MEMFIKSSACVSPQPTFSDKFPFEKIHYQNNHMSINDMSFDDYIPAKLSRRMSRVIKMGVASAMKCVQEAGISNPDAIITGTAFGCLEDTEQFISQMFEQNETMLSPTAFIQSTHNTVSAQIALLLKCHNYNNTFVHRGFSFEHALLDTRLFLEDNLNNFVLLGSADELTDIGLNIFQRLGVYKLDPISNFDISKSQTIGGLPGEGAAFFMISNQNVDAIAKIQDFELIYKPESDAEVLQKISDFLLKNNIKPDDIDLIITGENGDVNYDKVYQNIKQELFSNTTSFPYKSLSGEYATSTSFAVWLATKILEKGGLEKAIKDVNNTQKIKSILIYNHYINIHHAMFLITLP